MYTKDVTLTEMVDAMKHYSDDDVFRWFQDSTPSPTGNGAVATVTMRLTVGEVRKYVTAALRRIADA